jgi:MFS family permease
MMAKHNGRPKLRKNFSKLWLASAISALGDGALLAAGPLLVASMTSNPVLIASAAFVQLVPWLLFSFASGVYVDRFEKRRVILIANALRAIAIGGLAIAIGVDMASIPLIYGALFLLGLGDVLADGGAVTLLPKIVEKSQLSLANSRITILNTITRQFVGPPLGAYLFVAAVALPFGLDALSFVIAAMLITFIALPESGSNETKTRTRKTFMAEMKEGFAHLKQMPLLKTLTYVNFTVNITSMAITATLVIYAKQQLHLDSLGYGLFLSAAAVGGIVGGAITPRLHVRFSKPRILLGVLLLEATLNFSFVFLHSPWIAGVLYGLWSIVGTVWFLTILSLRQQTVTAEILGRVNGIYNFYRMGGIAIGALVGGFWVSLWGMTAPYWIGGAVVSLVASTFWHSLSGNELGANGNQTGVKVTK